MTGFHFQCCCRCSRNSAAATAYAWLLVILHLSIQQIHVCPVRHDRYDGGLMIVIITA